MFYSTRHFIRAVIILVLITMMLRYIPNALEKVQSFFEWVVRTINNMFSNLQIRIPFLDLFR